MQLDQLPIESFVGYGLQDKAAQAVMSRWRLDQKILEGIIVANFKEMGLYFVTVKNKPLIMKHLIHMLKYSVEIQTAVKKTEQIEAMKKKSRSALE